MEQRVISNMKNKQTQPFSSGSMVLALKARETEVHPISNKVAFSFYNHEGVRKLALNCWVDLLDIKESVVCGGSEIFALIWGLPFDETSFYKKSQRVNCEDVSLTLDETKSASACFFNGEFFDVSSLWIESKGNGKFRLWMRVRDISGSTDDFQTEVWVDSQVRDNPCEMTYPQW